MQNYKSGSHIRYDLKYHIVWILDNKVKKKEYFIKICFFEKFRVVLQSNV
jgi:REP element-mobilizing transposase RayT